MTITEAYEILSNGLINAPSEYEWCVAFITAINTMHKYQKIEEIVEKWSEDEIDYEEHYGDDYMEKIQEVLEDGNYSK